MEGIIYLCKLGRQPGGQVEKTVSLPLPLRKTDVKNRFNYDRIKKKSE